MFKSNAEYAETLYQLQQHSGEIDSAVENGEWVPVEDKPNLQDTYPSLVNIMVSIRYLLVFYC